MVLNYFIPGPQSPKFAIFYDHIAPVIKKDLKLSKL